MGQIKNIKLHIVTDIKIMEEEVDFASESIEQPITHSFEVEPQQPQPTSPTAATTTTATEGDDHTDKHTSLKHRDPNRFPYARVRNIMKMDPDLAIASQESVFMITKAAELFVQLQAQEAYKKTILHKRKTVQRKDLDVVLDELDCMAFLEGVL